jgi:hypothetical protein
MTYQKRNYIAILICFGMMLFFPIAFTILVNNPSEITSLIIGLFYALAGFIILYLTKD